MSEYKHTKECEEAGEKYFKDREKFIEARKKCGCLK